jgi:hypothetical protein
MKLSIGRPGDGRAPKTALRALGSLILFAPLKQCLGKILHRLRVFSYRLLTCGVICMMILGPLRPMKPFLTVTDYRSLPLS